MNSERFKDIVQTYKTLKNLRLKYEQDWKETLRFVAPRSTEFDTDTEPSKRSLDEYQSKLYDKEIQIYSEYFAMGLKGYTCSSQSGFFSLIPTSPVYIRDEQTKAILQARASQMYDMLASSRFYKTTWPFLKNMGDFGTAVMLLGYDEAHQRFLFDTLSLGDCYMMRDRNTDDVDILFHVEWLTRSEAISRYGKENLSAAIINEQDYTKSFQFIQLYCRRDEFDLNMEEGVPGTEWIELAWEKDQNEPCYISGTDEKRFVTATFKEAVDKSAYGSTSPGMILAGVSKSLQRMMKDQLNASQYMVNPPLKKTPGFVADIKPGGFVDVPPGQDIAVLDMVKDVSWTNETRNQLKMQAKQLFFVDFFLMLSQYQGNVNTATLAEGLQNEQVKMMTAFLDSLLDDFFSPIILWIYGIMERQGLFAGDAAGELDSDVRVKMVSTLYRLQQEQELQPTQKAMGMLLPYIQLDPSLLDYVDFQEFAEEVRDKTNANMKIIRNRQKVEEIKADTAKAKADAARKEQDIAQQEADTRTFAALSAAQNNQGEGSPDRTGAVSGQNESQAKSRYSGLRLRR